MSATNFINKINSVLIQVQKHGGVIENSTIVYKIQAMFLQHQDYRATISISMTTPNLLYSKLRKSLLNVNSVLKSSLVLKHSYQPQIDSSQESREEEIACHALRRFPYNCFHCGRSGHQKSECQSQHLSQNPQVKAAEETFLASQNQSTCQATGDEQYQLLLQMSEILNKMTKPYPPLIVDSGSFPSIVPPHPNLSDVCKIPLKNAIQADGSPLHIDAKAKCDVFSSCPNLEVFVSPNVDEPLLSISQCCQDLRLSAILD